METDHQPSHNERVVCQDDAVKRLCCVRIQQSQLRCFPWINQLAVVGWLMVGWRARLTATSTFVLDRWLLRPVRMQRRKLGGWRARNRQVGIWRRRTSSWRCCLSVTRPRLGNAKSCSCECLRFDNCYRSVVSYQGRWRWQSIAIFG